MLKYVLWNFDTNKPYNDKIYSTIQGAKGAANYEIKWKSFINLGIMEIELKATEKAFKKIGSEWLPMNELAKLLYL